MALRIHTYTGLLYQELVRNEAPGVADRRLPPVLPVVLYNGAGPWTAARRMSGLVVPGGPWLAPYQPAQGYFLLDLRRMTATICLGAADVGGGQDDAGRTSRRMAQAVAPGRT